MKRLNPETGKPFKYGDRRADGFRFHSYKPEGQISKKGYRYERWLSPESFEKQVQWARASSKKVMTERRKFFQEYKVNKGCCDCGYNAHPAALQFDHVPGTKKLFEMSHIGRPWELLMEEMKKCEVVCANCHSIRTLHRRHNSL